MIVKDIDGIERDICDVDIGVCTSIRGFHVRKPYMVLGLIREEDGKEAFLVVDCFFHEKEAIALCNVIRSGLDWEFLQKLHRNRWKFFPGLEPRFKEVYINGRQ